MSDSATTGATGGRPTFEPVRAPIVEPSAPLRFRRPEARLRHVEKHVLGARSERWGQLVGIDLLAGTRDERASGVEYGPRFEALAAAYEQAIAAMVLELAAEGRGHVHSAKVEVDEDLKATPVALVVRGWCPRRRVTAVAQAFVRNGEARAYSVRTGYRSALQEGAGNFDRSQRRRALEKLVIRAEHLLADHSGTASARSARTRS